MAKKSKLQVFPDEVYVYVCDYDDGEPLLAVSTDKGDLAEFADGEPVAVYILKENLGIAHREVKFEFVKD